DGRLLRDHYATMWNLLASYYQQDKRILGFDLLNEPNPGLCFSLPRFAGDVLGPYYDDLRRTIRKTGAPQALVYQPAVSRGSPLATVPDALGPNAIFAPHVFTQTYGVPYTTSDGTVPLDANYDRAQELADVVGGPLLLGEIGASAPGTAT